MPVATAPKTQPEFLSKVQFTTSKLIQNLGSNREQYKFANNLRTAWGRD